MAKEGPFYVYIRHSHQGKLRFLLSPDFERDLITYDDAVALELGSGSGDDLPPTAGGAGGGGGTPPAFTTAFTGIVANPTDEALVLRISIRSV